MNTINYEIFNKLKYRMKAKFPILLQGFIKDAKEYLTTIQANIPQGNIRQVIEASHSLKSASGLLGLTDVHTHAEKLEYMSKEMQAQRSANLNNLQPTLDELKNSFFDIETHLQNELTNAKSTT